MRLLSFPKVFPTPHLFDFSRFSTKTNISDIFVGTSLKNPTHVKGWVKALRRMKDTVFIDINDGTHPRHLQLIIHKSLVPKDLSFGASIESTGNLTTNTNDQVEFVCDNINVVGPCVVEEGYPFSSKKLYSDNYLRQFPHLRCRTNRFSSMLRIRHCCWSAVHDFFAKRGFIHIDTPILTSNDCEGAGEVFKVLPEVHQSLSTKDTKDNSYFDTKTFLTVSGQLHLEAMARSLSQVYCFGPTFRAENSKSRLHLSEFYMVEAESSYISNIFDIVNLVELLVKETFAAVYDKCEEDIICYNKFNETPHKMSDVFLNNIVTKQFSVIPYCEVADILEKESHRFNTKFIRGTSLSKDQELFLVKYNNDVPIFVIDWPRDIKPFYMKVKEGGDDLVVALDLLCPVVGEVCGGSVREDDYQILKTKIDSLNMTEKLGWYLELRKFGNVATGGFGLGFERLLQVFLGTNNIKDTIPFPRWPHNCQL